jgi:hypothetical protein
MRAHNTARATTASRSASRSPVQGPFHTASGMVTLGTVTQASQPVRGELELFDVSPDALCIAGLDGYLQRVNPAFARILGYTQEQLLARPFMDNVHPDDVESVHEVLAALARGQGRRRVRVSPSLRGRLSAVARVAHGNLPRTRRCLWHRPRCHGPPSGQCRVESAAPRCDARSGGREAGGTLRSCHRRGQARRARPVREHRVLRGGWQRHRARQLVQARRSVPGRDALVARRNQRRRQRA